MKRVFSALTLAAVLMGGVGVAEAGEIFDRVKARGHVNCGLQAGMPGFSFTDEQGVWQGFTAVFCRAVAAAMFNDPTKVEFFPSSVADRFTQLQAGETDLIPSLTGQYARDVSLGLRYVGTIFFTGQGFIMPKKLGITDPEKLDGATACVATGTTSELQTADFFRTRGLNYRTVGFENFGAMLSAYQEGRCDTMSLDHHTLSAFRLTFKSPDDHFVAPKLYTELPNGPFVSDRDPQWINVVRWTLNAIIRAEIMGITQANVDELKAKSEDPDVRRFLGVNAKLGEMMGLSNDWAYNIVKGVGNYGEIYERELGPKTRINIPRGPNRLVNDGGWLYAPYIR